MDAKFMSRTWDEVVRELQKCGGLPADVFFHNGLATCITSTVIDKMIQYFETELTRYELNPPPELDRMFGRVRAQCLLARACSAYTRDYMKEDGSAYWASKHLQVDALSNKLEALHRGSETRTVSE